MSGLAAEDVAEIIDAVDAGEQHEELAAGSFDEPSSDGADEYGDEEYEEIDMRNNSVSYFDRHADSVFVVRAHPTEPLIVSGGADNAAYVWSATTPPALVAQLPTHAESVASAVFLASGDFLVTGDMSGYVRVFKRSEGWAAVFEAKEVEEIVTVVAHQRLPLFAVACDDGSVWVYEVSDARQGAVVDQIAVFNLFAGPVSALAFAPGSDELPRLLAVSEDGSVRMLDVYAGQPLYQVETDHPWVQLALSPSGQTAALGAVDGFVALVKLDNGAVLKQLDTSTLPPEDLGRSVEGVAWCDAQHLLAVGGVDGSVRVYDTLTWRVRAQCDAGEAVTKLVFVPKTALLVVAGARGALFAFDALSSQRVWEGHGHNEGVLDFALLGERRIVTAGDDNVCLVFDREG